jgi:ATP-dependent Zn protease
MVVNLATWLNGWNVFGPARNLDASGGSPVADPLLPDRRAREGCLAEATRGLALARDVDLALLARTTTGLTSLELARLCERAGRIATAAGAGELAMAHFAQALDGLVLAGARPVLLDSGERSLAAYHEAGHALAAWLTAAATPPGCITILSHVGSDHRPEPLPPPGPQAASLPALLVRLDVLLAGPVAEELGAEEIGEAGQADGCQAISLAGQIVQRWGSAAVLGPAQVGEDAATPADDDPDGAAHLIVERRAVFVRDLLARSQPALEALERELVEEETVDAARVAALLGPRPQSRGGTP